MGRDIGGHAHGDARRTVDQQTGKPGGQNKRLLQLVVVVGHKIHRVLLDVAEHMGGQFGHSGLCITIGRRRVAVHAAKIAVAVYHGISQGKILGHADKGVVDRGVAMGVIPAQNVAHSGGGFAVGLIRRQIVLIHGVKNAAMHRFESVPHVGQRPAYDDAHGISDIRFPHLFF